MTVSASPSVAVRVLLFAMYAEALGRTALELQLDPPATVASLVQAIRRLPGGDRLPPRPLCAVNLAHASPDTPLASGDEVAVLPPLAGG